MKSRKLYLRPGAIHRLGLMLVFTAGASVVAVACGDRAYFGRLFFVAVMLVFGWAFANITTRATDPRVIAVEHAAAATYIAKRMDNPTDWDEAAAAQLAVAELFDAGTTEGGGARSAAVMAMVRAGRRDDAVAAAALFADDPKLRDFRAVEMFSYIHTRTR